MKETIWTSPDGTEFAVLPRTWGNATNISEEWALAHGWRTEEREMPDPPEPVLHYSKYKLHLALGMQDLWDAFWNALDDSQKQLWNDAQVLQSDDPFFTAALAGITEHLRNR